MSQVCALRRDPIAGASGGDIFEQMKSEGAPEAAEAAVLEAVALHWLPEAERELKKIPFFVRGKAKRNTESYAADRGVVAISVETLYEAKAHYAR